MESTNDMIQLQTLEIYQYPFSGGISTFNKRSRN